MHLPSRPADWWLLCRHRRVSFLFSGGVRRAGRGRRHTPWSTSVGGSATPMLYVVCELPVRRRCPAALRSVRGRTALPPRHQFSAAAAAATTTAATRSSPSVLSAVKQFVRSSIHQRAWISAQLQSILQRHASSMRHSMVHAGHSASSSSSSPFLPPFVPFKRTLCTTDTDLCSCPPSSSHGQQSTQTVVETQRPYCTAAVLCMLGFHPLSSPSLPPSD